jgi:signal transduction histidine kinase
MPAPTHDNTFNWKERSLAFLIETGTVDYFVNTEAYRNNAVLRFKACAGCDHVHLVKKADGVADSILLSSQTELTGLFTETSFLNGVPIEELFVFHEHVSLPTRSHFLTGTHSVLYIPLVEANYEGSVILTWDNPFTLSEDYIKFLKVCINRLKEVVRLNFAFHTFDELRVKFMAVFNTVSNSLVFLDNDGKDAWLNPQAIQLLDLTESAEITPANISANMRKLRERAQNANEIIIQAAEFFRFPDKAFSNWIWKYEKQILKVSSAPVVSEHIKGRLWVFEDISEVFFTNEKLQWLNQELNSANEEIRNSFENLSDKNKLIENQNDEIRKQNERLEIINREKDNLIGIVSHDLRTPLQQVKGLTDILLQDGDKLDSEQRFIIDRMMISVERGLNLIKDLLDVTRLEQHQDNGVIAPLDVAEFLREDLTSFQQAASKKNISIHFSSHTKHTVILADRDLFRRIVDNLVSNAIKFSPHHRSVYVTLHEREQVLQLGIRDEGQGMTEMDKKKLFQKFSKLSARPTGDESSTGLGLYIVKTLVEELNGRITCESEWQKGTTFTLEFPLKK